MHGVAVLGGVALPGTAGVPADQCHTRAVNGTVLGEGPYYLGLLLVDTSTRHPASIDHRPTCSMTRAPPASWPPPWPAPPSPRSPSPPPAPCHWLPSPPAPPRRSRTAAAGTHITQLGILRQEPHPGLDVVPQLHDGELRLVPGVLLRHDPPRHPVHPGAVVNHLS